MSSSAHVTSIDAVGTFRTALRTFQDQAAHALVALEEQARRALQWLEHEAPLYWRGQIRNCYDEVARARTALETCRMRAVGDHRPACLEEQEALRHAQRWLREAEDKLEAVRHWTQKVREELDEYRGRMMRSRHCVENAVPKSLALLDRTLSTLDSYVDRPAPVEVSGSTSPPAGSLQAGLS
ncbi:MAG: hypothetical protein HY290_24810 [Planctomycetia bacterium]|nr:hypothetical protein [Planctomycetia bacterium]